MFSMAERMTRRRGDTAIRGRGEKGGGVYWKLLFVKDFGMVTVRARWIAGVVAGVAMMAGSTGRALGWSHQGHILMTRMAALRIINDPGAPQGLKEFLKENMKYDLEACRRLATEEMVGADPKNYLVGLDGACTFPDRVRGEPGKELVQPYGAPESKMHFMDLEWFSKEPVYKGDLSNRPKIEEIKQDMKDPRWRQAGYVPFRVEESYSELKKAFVGAAGGGVDKEQALKWMGYLCHYIEDCHQPHHATVDFKSLSYLAGKVEAVHEVKRTLSNGTEVVEYKVDEKDRRAIDPHGDLEFQLFENDKEPRKGLRAEFWRELNQRIEKQADGWRVCVDSRSSPGSFKRALEILWESYEYLPAVGKAAAAGHAGGKFDAGAFFTSKEKVRGEELDTVQLIAERNAAAVLEVERTLRAAWAEAEKLKIENGK